MVRRLAIVVLTCGLTGLPALAAPCAQTDALPGVSAGPRSAATTSAAKTAAPRTAARKALPSQNCDLGFNGDVRKGSEAVARKGNALKFGDTEIRINGRVRVEGAYGR